MKTINALLFFTLISYSSRAQVKPDSVFIHFNPKNILNEVQNPDSYTIDDQEIQVYYFIIKMGTGIDLCFGNSIYEGNSYRKLIPMEELTSLDIRDYQWVRDNYYLYDDPGNESEYMKLCEDLLKIDYTEFFLVIPDSLKQTAEILHVFNCNYVEY